MNVPKSIFRQYDVRGIVGAELTPELARGLGRAFASVAWERLGRAPDHRRRTRQPALGPRALAAASGGASWTPAAPRWTWARCPRPRSTSPSPRSETDGGLQVTGVAQSARVQRLQDGPRRRGLSRRRDPRALGDHHGRAVARAARGRGDQRRLGAPALSRGHHPPAPAGAAGPRGGGLRQRRRQRHRREHPARRSAPR